MCVVVVALWWLRMHECVRTCVHGGRLEASPGATGVPVTSVVAVTALHSDTKVIDIAPEGKSADAEF